MSRSASQFSQANLSLYLPLASGRSAAPPPCITVGVGPLLLLLLHVGLICHYLFYYFKMSIFVVELCIKSVKLVTTVEVCCTEESRFCQQAKFCLGIPSVFFLLRSVKMDLLGA